MLVAFFLCCLGFATVGGTLTNCIAWPKYVTPNETTACNCSYIVTGASTFWYILWEDPDGEVVGQTKGRWDRRTQTLGLSLADIKKEDDGRNFSCYHVDGVRRTLLDTYIPFLAYGPDDVTITSTQTIRHDDTEKMVTTLTCSASVKPTAKFQWQGQPTGAVALPGCSCDNYTSSETLTFDSDLYQDGEVIKCTVANTGGYWPNSVEKDIILRSRPESPISDQDTKIMALSVSLGVAVLLVFALACSQIKQCRTNGGPAAVNNGGGGP
ncbi:uncharacterized protein, partial [Littorina saxatilis]|uniref:uncharacterized protein n=1 Tax=Littorina saxatilis TaxID=31220 RepID=UPI0038B68BBB